MDPIVDGRPFPTVASVTLDYPEHIGFGFGYTVQFLQELVVHARAPWI